jgi:hypothetical protein
VQIRRRKERGSCAGLLATLRVCDIFVVDKDLGHIECWHGCHAALLLLLHRATEAASPVQGVEETNNDIASDSFFHTLQASSASQELFKSKHLSA